MRRLLVAATLSCVPIAPVLAASFEERVKLNPLPSRSPDAVHILATEWDNSPFPAAYERAKAKGWQTRTVPCGHEVMLDLPDELADLLLEFTAHRVASGRHAKENNRQLSHQNAD